ncbi:unnamed protein product [Nesidiocoris tenuis]|uniref:Uncharacterized protein n=1 Tax=Nesidiocoris tenuis TaxID=355587 RepID=A0A6H5GHG4_9HEMI|nr:unnamed protein product [Nesidiocoris tenuis]
MNMLNQVGRLIRDSTWPGPGGYHRSQKATAMRLGSRLGVLDIAVPVRVNRAKEISSPSKDVLTHWGSFKFEHKCIKQGQKRRCWSTRSCSSGVKILFNFLKFYFDQNEVKCCVVETSCASRGATPCMQPEDIGKQGATSVTSLLSSRHFDQLTRSAECKRTADWTIPPGGPVAVNRAA